MELNTFISKFRTRFNPFILILLSIIVLNSCSKIETQELHIHIYTDHSICNDGSNLPDEIKELMKPFQLDSLKSIGFIPVVYFHRLDKKHTDSIELKTPNPRGFISGQPFKQRSQEVLLGLESMSCNSFLSEPNGVVDTIIHQRLLMTSNKLVYQCSDLEGNISDLSLLVKGIKLFADDKIKGKVDGSLVVLYKIKYNSKKENLSFNMELSKKDNIISWKDFGNNYQYKYSIKDISNENIVLPELYALHSENSCVLTKHNLPSNRELEFKVSLLSLNTGKVLQTDALHFAIPSKVKHETKQLITQLPSPCLKITQNKWFINWNSVGNNVIYKYIIFNSENPTKTYVPLNNNGSNLSIDTRNFNLPEETYLVIKVSGYVNNNLERVSDFKFRIMNGNGYVSDGYCDALRVADKPCN